MENIFLDIGLVIIIATLAAYVISLMRQPLILAYMIAGLAIGPAFLGLINNTEVIMTLSGIGIAFLLFIVGLEIDLRKLRNLGWVATVVGTGQVFLTFLLGFFAALYFGFVHVEALYIALALALSSTMVVVKLLSDKREIDTLHGRIIISILLVQDVVAILALAVIPSLNSSALFIVEAVAKGAAMLFVAVVLTKFVIPKVFGLIAHSRELLFLSSVAWCFLAAISAGLLGYSIAIGAFLAGVSLASLKYNLEIISMVRPLRDFFATIFFVSLGMQISMAAFYLFMPIIIFSLIVVVGSTIVTMFLMALMGYGKRTSFFTAIAIAQISEFSLIIVALGYSMGQVSQEVVSLIAAVAIITITITTYFIKYDNSIYLRISRLLSLLEKLPVKSRETGYKPAAFDAEIVLCGYDRIGYSIFRRLGEKNKRLLVIDYNPEVIKDLAGRKIPCIYGDIGDLEILDRINLKKIEALISTIPDKQDNLLLVRELKKMNRKALIVVTASQIDDALELYDAGADYVILPHFLGGEHVSVLLEDFSKDLSKVVKTRLMHIKELHNRKKMGHEHPGHHTK